MHCQGCGSKMELVRHSVEGNKLYQWYRCPNLSCGEDVLDIKPAGDGGVDGIVAAPQEQ